MTRFLSSLIVATFSMLTMLSGGTVTRVPNETLRLPKELPEGSFRTETAFDGLSFRRPVAIVTPPGEKNRLFVLEQDGIISVLPNLEEPSKETFLDLTADTAFEGESGLLGLAFHPQYAENGYFYVFYTTTIDRRRTQRLARFERDPKNEDRALRASELPMIDQRDDASNHNGGDLQFGPDGYLYVSYGDEGGANDQFNNSLYIDRDFFAGIARIDVDQREGSLPPNPHPSVHADTYTIPVDNPFIGITSHLGETVDPSEVRTEFWALGLRNPWRMAFDAPSGRLFCADVGQNAREEINVIERGAHYGWSLREGTRNFTNGPSRANEPDVFAPVEPIWDYPRSEGISITGGLVYRGESHTELYEAYIFSDYGSGRIWALHFNDDGSTRSEQIASDSQVSAFGIDPRNGDVLFTSYGAGELKRIARKGKGFALLIPSKLSLTGAFADLGPLTPNEGIVSYEPNVSFWSDGALKKRWFSVPSVEDTITFSPNEPWAFPAGTTWIKHFELGGRHVETRFLVKTDTSSYGLTYAWNDEQTDATLVTSEGMETDIVVQGETTQTWSFPSRNACRTCHTREAGHALGFQTAQLNRSHDYPDGTANQLGALSEAGYFEQALPLEIDALPKLAALEDMSRSLEDRARAYLATNCAQCHRPDGPALGFWDARAHVTLIESGLIEGKLVQDLGSSYQVIAPRRPELSMILTRMMGGEGLTKMPPLGSNVTDDAGIALLREWVLSLGQEQTLPSDLQSWIEIDGKLPYLALPSASAGRLEIEKSSNLQQWEPWIPTEEATETRADGSRRFNLDRAAGRDFYRFRVVDWAN
ncbi:MAG: putative repeat protein (TIGR03806 family) [Verrucomicrobiales bacterium]|jgi:uncharacterized repeat protein (TIGR03806 family)